MPDTRTLQILLTMKDTATKEMQKLGKQSEKMQKSFKKMAVVGVAGLAAITVGIGKAVKDAGVMEGALAKFNTVFGDGREDMLDFVNTIRKEMPTARAEIIAMASGVQDLLVPMGLARDESQEMTKRFLDLSNKIGAFNDVNPEQVLNAIKSGLVGSSEPLRAYGVDARVGALETVALNEGLIQAGQSFSDLTPEVAAQVQAQALLLQITNQNSDAIEGFAENQDSFIRRQQELKATMEDVSATIGEIFLPIIDDMLKKLLPLISKVSDWIKENPKLAKTIIIVVAGLTALLAVVGLLGLALPAIISGFTLLLGPVGLVILAIGALITVGVLLWKNWDKIKDAASNAWGGIKNVIVGTVESIQQAIKDMINGVVDKLNFLVRQSNKIQGGLNKVPGVNIPLIPEIPRLAKGGIVTKPTIALIGEQGPEAVVPLNRNRQGVGGGIVINVFGDVSGQELITKVSEGIMNQLRTNLRVPV